MHYSSSSIVLVKSWMSEQNREKMFAGLFRDRFLRDTRPGTNISEKEKSRPMRIPAAESWSIIDIIILSNTSIQWIEEYFLFK